MSSRSGAFTHLTRVLIEPQRMRNRLLETVRTRSIGTYEWRVEIGAVERPAYAYCVRAAARLGSLLGLSKVSVVELGVAGGNGLLALEEHARRWSATFGVEIEVYGFDTGKGLPASDDYRDLRYHWRGGFYEMDDAALRRRLRPSTTLVLGDIAETVRTFTETHRPAPIGAVMYDMDLYSSTVAGLQLLDIDEAYRLPRVLTYFDDIIGSDISLFSDYTGERLAISEFNDGHESHKISPVHHLTARGWFPWHHQVFVAHDFLHSRYNDFVSTPDAQLPLRQR